MDPKPGSSLVQLCEAADEGRTRVHRAQRRKSRFSLMEQKEHLKTGSVCWEEPHCFWHRSLGSEEQLGHRSSSAGTAGL